MLARAGSSGPSGESVDVGLEDGDALPDGDDDGDDDGDALPDGEELGEADPDGEPDPDGLVVGFEHDGRRPRYG